MGQPSDEELLAAIAAGPGAIAEFYRRHVARVTAMGARRFGNPEDVADFVATVFVEVLDSADGFDPGRGRAVAWLYGVGGNVATAMYRQRSRAVRAEQRISGRALLDPDDYARVEERIDAAARLRQTYLAMRDLPEQDRRLLELVAVDGLGTHEAARALMLTPVAARVRLSRARRRLRVVLAQQDGRGTRALHIIQEGSA
jgi:RNA polymerase sigma factor (sigma-70 family)